MMPDCDRSSLFEQARSEWLYARNPEGAAEILGLRQRDSGWVGMVALIPRRLWSDGIARRAAYPCDFYVHPKHRSLLPALALQRSARIRARETKSACYAIPNQNSLPIFRRLGADLILNRYRWVRPLQSRPFLARRNSGRLQGVSPCIDALGLAYDHLSSMLSRDISAEWLTSIDDRFDTLWSQTPKAGLNVGDRTAAYLRWRFMDEPGRRSLILGLFDRRTRRLLGYMVGSLSTCEFVIRDFLSVSRHGISVATLSHALIAIRETDASAVSVRITGQQVLYKALRAAGFWPRDPEKTFIQFGGETNARRWYLTSADEDV